MASSIISVNQLVKIYQMGELEVHALRGVSLEVFQGDFVAIMGKSGSGKSTFMNIIGCLDTPTSGDYFLDGVDVTTLSRDALARLRNLKIGFVFQSYNLLSRTTALENVELPLMYNLSVDSKEMRERAMHALDIVGLADRATHIPSQLSGGEQQRVALARALINDPRVILADEPTGNLDTRTGIEMMEIFQELNDKGITIIIVTHELEIASFTKRNVNFRDGRITRMHEVLVRKIASEELLAMPVQKEEDEV